MLRLGIAGMGYIGGVHRAAAEALGPDLVQVTAVATSRREAVSAPAPGAPAPRVFTDYDAMLTEAPVDAVVIATPTFRHERDARMAIASGRHVLCEKPLALDAASGERIVTAAATAGLTFMVAQVLRFWPQYVRILEAVATGELGAIRAVHASRLSAFPHRSAWFADPAKSGGGLLDLHIHDVDFVYALLGAPQQIHCAGQRSTLTGAGRRSGETGGFDSVWSQWRYREAIADLRGDLRMPASWPLRASLLAVGESGAIEYAFSAPGNVGALRTARQDLVYYPTTGSPSPIAVPEADPFVEQMRYFLACASSGAPPLRCPPQDSLAVMRLMDATLASVRRSEAGDQDDSTFR